MYFTSNFTAALQSRITQYSYFDYNVKLGDFPLHNNNEINAATTDLIWQGFIIKHHFLAFHDSFKTIILRLSFFLSKALIEHIGHTSRNNTKGKYIYQIDTGKNQ